MRERKRERIGKRVRERKGMVKCYGEKGLERYNGVRQILDPYLSTSLPFILPSFLPSFLPSYIHSFIHLLPENCI